MVYGRLTISSTSLFVALTLAISCHLHHDPDCLANVNGLQVLPVRARHRHGEGTTLHERAVLVPSRTRHRSPPAQQEAPHNQRFADCVRGHEASSRHAPEILAYTLVPD